MNKNEKTIADVLKPLGYDSHMIGKVSARCWCWWWWRWW